MSLFRKMTWMGAVAALALSWAGSASADDAADTAVKAAQKYRGQTITIVWEAGLQSLDPQNFSGPKWEAADRHQGQGDRGADRRDVHQDHAGIPRRHRRL